MDQEQIRLGGVEAVYERDRSLVLREVHQSKNEIKIYRSDIPELIRFLSRHDVKLKITRRSNDV